MSIKKVVIVTNVPNPYRIPLFNEIHMQLLQKGIELKVLFGSESYTRRKFRLNLAECSFAYEFLESGKYHFGNEEKTYFTYKGLIKALKKENADRVVINGFSLGTTRLWWYSFFRKTAYIIWSGAIEKEGRNDSFLRRIQRKLVSSRVISFITYGTLSGKYLKQLGIPEEKIYIAINTVDTTFFSTETRAIRKSLAPESKVRLTFIGYLSPRKNVMRVLEIVQELRQEGRSFVLDIIGDGEDKPNLEKFVHENSLDEFVHFHGFRQKAELPAFLAVSKCFLFQTDFDIWGLVLNEAMAAGLPCISSVHAGATADLIKDQETGFVVDYKDKEQVKNRIRWVMDHPDEAEKIGQKARAFIEKEVSIQVSASGFVKGILHGVSA